MFWQNSEPYIDSSTFIVSGEEYFTFSEVFKIGDDITSEILEGSVVLIECLRDLDTVCAYIGCLRKKLCP